MSAPAFKHPEDEPSSAAARECAARRQTEHPTDEELAMAYSQMRADEEREREALEWAEAFVGETLE